MSGQWDIKNKEIGNNTPISSASIISKKEAIAKHTSELDKEKVKFSDDKIKEWLFGDMERSSSNVCCAIYGHDGTAKSGIALDSRTEEEKKQGYKLIVFDLDGGCAPLKVIYHNNETLSTTIKILFQKSWTRYF